MARDDDDVGVIRVPHEGPWTMTPWSDPATFATRMIVCIVGWELVRFVFVLASRAIIVGGKDDDVKVIARVRL